METNRQSFGVIIATRNIFNCELAVSARKQVLEKLDKSGFDYVILPSKETPTGNIEGYEDAKKCAACVTMSMMGEKLMPSACEVDVAGTIGMYALALAAQVPSALLDWNNNFDKDRDKVVCTHFSKRQGSSW